MAKDNNSFCNYPRLVLMTSFVIEIISKDLFIGEYAVRFRERSLIHFCARWCDF